MEPAKLILLAIALLGVILIALLFYLLVIFPKGKSAQALVEESKRHDLLDRLQAPSDEAAKQPLTHVPGMDSVHETVDAQNAQLRKKAGPTDVTPPAGISRSDLRDLLTDTGVRIPQTHDDRTPAGGMDSLAARPKVRPDRETAPQPTSAAPAPDAGPPRKRTVALNASFFDDDAPAPRIAPPAPTIPTISRPKPIVPAAPRPSSLAGASTTPAVAPTVRPAPRPSVPTSAPVASAPFPSPQAAPFRADLREDEPTQELRSIASLPERFRDRNLAPQTRVEAFTQLLAQTEPEEKVLLIVEAINDDLMELQLVALQEITSRTADTLLDEVIPLVESDSPEVALGAVKALENIGGPVVEQALLAALECPHVQVQRYAESALVHGATPALEEQLHEMVNEDDTRQVEVAARLLAKLGGAENAEVIETRAALTPVTTPLHAILQQAAIDARKTERSSASHDDAPFGAAEAFALGSADMEEFELSLDPELFNPKS